MQKKQALPVSLKRGNPLKSNNSDLYEAKRLFKDDIFLRVSKRQENLRFGVKGGEMMVDFAFPEKGVCVDIVPSDASGFDLNDKTVRAANAGWTLFSYRASSVLAASSGNKKTLYAELLTYLGLSDAARKVYLCEFCGCWEDRGTYRIFNATNQQDLNDQIKQFLAECGIGHPDVHPNARQGDRLMFHTVHSYEIASTQNFDVHAYVADLEKQQRDLYDKLRAKYEGNEDELKTYERLKSRYGAAKPSQSPHESTSPPEWLE